MFAYFFDGRDAPSVSEQPVVELLSWRMLRRPDGQVYVTAELRPGTFRISSALVAVDLSARVATTQSGRRYHFKKAPAEEEPLKSMILANAVHWGVVDAVDVSEALWRTFMEHRALPQQAPVSPTGGGTSQN